MLNDAGEIESVTGICSDITGLKQRERELNIALRNQQAVFDAAGEGIAFVRRGRIEGPNGALARMLGVPRESLIGIPVADILANRGDWETIEHGTSAAGVKGDAAIHEVMLRGQDGRTIWCQLTSRQAGEANSRILVLTDISALKKREELAWHHANHDELTGLPNRRLLVEHARRLSIGRFTAEAPGSRTGRRSRWVQGIQRPVWTCLRRYAVAASGAAPVERFT